MKTKLFLLAFLLTAFTFSLQAMIGSDRPQEEAESNQGQHPREATDLDSVDSSYDWQRGRIDSLTAAEKPSSGLVASAAQSESEEVKDLSPAVKAGRMQQWRLNSLQRLVQEAQQAGDLDAPAWKQVSARVRLAKNWVESILNPPPLSTIDRWLGKEQEKYSPVEENAAKFVQFQAVAVEAALPAWKATTALKKAIAARKARGLAETATAQEAAQESTDCWAFFRKAPESPIDLNDDVIQKASAVAAAWVKAHADLESQTAFFQKPATDGKAPLVIDNEILPKKNRLAEVYAAELLYFNHMREVSALSIQILDAQQRVEAALRNYENMPAGEIDPSTSILELQNFLNIISSKKENASSADKEHWDAELKRLSYIISVYDARCASIKFDHALKALQEKKEGQNLNDPVDNPVDNPVNSLEQDALSKWGKAIKAKEQTLPEESRQRILSAIKPAKGPSNTEPVVLTPKEEAAKKRILEFRAEYDRIKEVLEQNE